MRIRTRRVVGAALALACVLATLAACAPSPSPKPPTPVVLIMLENKTYSNVLGNPQAPFLNSMIRHGKLFSHYTGTPNSLKNYLLITAGNRDVVTNALSAPADAPNLFTALGTNHTWRTYAESMPWPCYPGVGSGTVKGNIDPLYKKGHNPALFYTGVTATHLCANDVPLRKSFDPAGLPEFSLVVPNTCDDMHSMPADRVCPMWNGAVNHGDTELELGDRWLAAFVPSVAARATVLITFDEGTNADEHIVTLEYGQGVVPGVDPAPYDHANMEAGLYRRFGLGPAPAAGATAVPLPIP